MKLLNWLYALSLYAFPREFRTRFGPEMQQLFRTHSKDAPHLSSFLLVTAQDLIITSVQERFAAMKTPRFARQFAYAAGTAVLFLVVSATMVQAFVIPTASMEPGLRPGDYVLVNKTARNPQRDELVVFRYPEDPSQTFIKRVIGLPGDHIRLENKQVIRNGERLVESYVQYSTDYVDQFRDNFPATPQVRLEPHGAEMLAKNVNQGEVTVPEGALFVLGDNRDVSLDSRFFGFVPQTNVLGRPWMVYWSYDSGSSKARWDRTLLEVR